MEFIKLTRVQGLARQVQVTSLDSSIKGHLTMSPELMQLFEGRQEMYFEATNNGGVLTLHRNVAPPKRF